MRISVVGGSGYAGGEVLRLLAEHPHFSLHQVTSESNKGTPIARIHPNLRKRVESEFCSIDDLEDVDVLVLALPHKETAKQIDRFLGKAEVIVDLSSDFRLKNKADYPIWYDFDHPCPELLERSVYGLAELNRERLKTAALISCGGCLASATILALAPLLKHRIIEERIIVEAKVGSSATGNKPTLSSHHPERSGAVRSFKATGHRHTAEIVQECGRWGSIPEIHFSATSIEMVRGILSTCQTFLKEEIDEREIWRIYRTEYGEEPFIRLVKDKKGVYRYPEPKLVSGTNFCDIGFERDRFSKRLVVMSAIDNLVKGTAGQAIQALNIRFGYPETTALGFLGLHPV